MVDQGPSSRSSSQPPFDPDAGAPREAWSGLIGSLFDLSFETFVTPKIIQVIFMVLLGIAGLWTLALITTAFSNGVAAGLLALVLSPVVFLVAVLFTRMYLELVIVLFRIYEVLRERA